MRISRVRLSNYKKFTREQVIEFKDDNRYDGNDVHLLVGNNGTGKSSLLQAIVLTTATASREGFDPEQLDWPGFVYSHIQTGRRQPSLNCEYEFQDDELDATYDYAKQLIDLGVRLDKPSKKKNVTLTFDYDNKRAKASEGASAFYQFTGYQYAKRLAKQTKKKNRLFDRVGNIFWYTEQRTAYSMSKMLDGEAEKLDWLRRFLSDAYAFHVALKNEKRELKEGQFDFFEDLSLNYSKVFPDRSLVGSALDFELYEQSSAPDFFLMHGVNEYEIGEMSAGERAIFPLLLDFTRWNINNSIIVIDEVELHLHTSLQQSFIRALMKLGEHNQFIFTTHSESVADMFAEEQIHRLT